MDRAIFLLEVPREVRHLPGLHKVVHEHSYGHGSDTSRDWGYEGASLYSCLEIDITDNPARDFVASVGVPRQPVAFLDIHRLLTEDFVDANINSYGAFLEPGPFEKIGAADGRDEYVSLSDIFLDVWSFRVTDRNCGIHLVQKESQRHSDYV
jgi:hypothetical protein